jgi:predicted dehydrogenase
MDNNLPRREFLAGLTASVAGAPAVLGQRNPNDTIGLAIVGVGTRGIYLLEEFQKINGVEIRRVADLYDGNIARAKKSLKSDKVAFTKSWEEAVTAKDIDAVVIATPDFWHAPMTVRAAQAKKDIYVEKGWCRTLPEAKAMRKAIKDNKVVMQLGHNYNSMPTLIKAREIFKSGELGKVPLVRTYIDRTRATPEWQFYTMYDIYEPPKDANQQSIDWERFIMNAEPRGPFDVEQFFTWRRWWKYGTGIAGDLMSHLWDAVNGVAGMGIPESMVTQGDLYFWKDGRDVPDMWHVLMDYPKKELAITFNCTFHNRHQGEVAEFMGRDATLEMAPDFCRVYGAEWKPENERKAREARRAGKPVGPDYELKPGEVTVTSHWQDFIDCTRTRETPRCGVDRAFEEAATIVLSVEAYKQNRRVRWDPVKEQVI